MPRRPAHPLVRFAIERRVTMGMVLVGILVLGGLALTRLPLEFLPAISSSNVSVQVPYPSASPQEVEQRIVRPLEDSFGTLNGLDRLSARASADQARIDLSFLDGTDMDLAAVEVRDRVDRVRHLLPSDVRQIRIRRFQSSDIPVVSFHLSAPWDKDRLYDYVERVVQRRLERLEGVAQVSVRGLAAREVEVRLDPDRLRAHGVDVRQVISRLRRNHLILPAGHLREGSRKLMVRVEGELGTLEEIRRLPLGGGGLTLGDVAEVAYDFPRQESFNYLNGVESLTLAIYKASTANLLAVVDRVKGELGELTEETGGELRTRIYHDSSLDVRKGLSDLRNAGLVGGGLAILAVFLFLRRVRTTLLIGIAIPVSVVFTFVLMFLLRQVGGSELTLNVVSLMGLVLALGMLVDNSIVVIESIYRRVEELGEDARTAALRGASEVALPILASTATTLCVFIPVIFLSGGSGFFRRYLTEIGTTVCIVLVASLLVALTVVPMAAVVLLSRERPRPARWLTALTRAYGWTLRLTLRWRLAFFLLSLLLLWGSWKLFGTIERSFAMRTQERQITVNVDLPRSYTLEQTRALFDDVAKRLQAKKGELDLADVTYRYTLGGGRSRGGDRDRRFDLYLVDEDEGELTTLEARDRIRDLLPVVPGVSFKIAQSQHRHGSSGLELELSGDDSAVLERVGRRVAGQIANLPGVEDVDLSLESGDDEVRVGVDRERALLAGLSSQAVASTVQGALSSRAVGTLRSRDREVDLVVQFREDQRESLDQLKNVAMDVTGEARGGDGARTFLPLDALAEFEVAPGPQSIERENRRAKITVSANLNDPMGLGRVMGQAQGVLGSLVLPPGYDWSFGRWNRIARQDQVGASFALLFAMLLVYLLMAALFESLSHPFAIMASIPFAFIGVGLVMKLFNQPRDNFTELGFLILVGVVVNNAIVLVDHVNRLRQEGHGRDEAILEGGRHRLRAILMTAVTTILGLLPMVAPVLFPQWFGPLEGRAATWAPVGLVILGGLTTSTFLTLVFIPTVYSLVDDLALFLRRVVRAAVGRGETPRRPGLRSRAGEGGTALVLAFLLLSLAACGGSAGPGGNGDAAGGDHAAQAGSRPEGRPGGPPGGRPGGEGGAPGSGSRGGSWGDQRGGQAGGRHGGPAGGWEGRAANAGSPAVPVEVARAGRRAIAQYFQTQGTLEAENEVDLVARTAGPVVELATEEGRRVREGELLARIDNREIRAQLEVARVRLIEAKTAYDRAKELSKNGLVSQEGFDRVRAEYQSAQGDFERFKVQLAYTEITAPFSGLIVARYVRFAEHVGVGDRLFRISDFDPLLCPIQVPERELPRLAVGQTAVLTVEAFPGRRFAARVLRLSPVVEAATGTVKVTLAVEGEDSLRPGMFATVRLEMERRPDALVIPKSALALDSLGDAVFVAENGVAERRSLTLGFQNEDLLEVTSGLSEGEPVIVLGQDGLSDGTPVEVMGEVEIADGADAGAVPAAARRRGPIGQRAVHKGSGRTVTVETPRGDSPEESGEERAEVAEAAPEELPGAATYAPRGPDGPFSNLDFDNLTPEQLERLRKFLIFQGVPEDQVDERIRQIKERRRAGPP